MANALLDPETIVKPKLDDGDHERFAHYFKKADLDRAWLDGQPIRALCGKKDVPLRDPQKYDLCPTCKEIFESIPDGDTPES